MKDELFRLMMLTIAAIMLVSCSAGENIVLQDITCSPPCWKKITPGYSNEQEVNSILRNLPEVKSDSIITTSVIGPNDSISFDFISDVGDGGGIILIRDGIAVAIDFGSGDRVLRFNEAVNIFGEPENVIVLYFKGERIQLSTFLLYPTKGVALLNIQVPFKGEQAQIEPNQQVEAFWYFDPKLFNELMTGGFISNHPLDVIQKAMQPWKGYGEYNFIQTDW